MSVECSVCRGCGAVVWECIEGISTPRAPHDNEEPEDKCPACDGNGIEPSMENED